MIRGFELVIRGFELITRGFKLVTRGFEPLLLSFQLVTRVLLYHKKKATDNFQNENHTK